MRVRCTRPNAAELISGVRFKPSDDGMISEEMPDDQAQVFLAIDGYSVYSEPSRRRPPKTQAKSDEE